MSLNAVAASDVVTWYFWKSLSKSLYVFRYSQYLWNEWHARPECENIGIQILFREYTITSIKINSIRKALTSYVCRSDFPTKSSILNFNVFCSLHYKISEWKRWTILNRFNCQEMLFSSYNHSIFLHPGPILLASTFCSLMTWKGFVFVPTVAIFTVTTIFSWNT